MLLQWLIFLSLVGQFSKSLLRFMNVGTLFLVVVTYAALVLINLLACIWFFVATLEGLSNSWVASVGEPQSVRLQSWARLLGKQAWQQQAGYISCVAVQAIHILSLWQSCSNLMGIQLHSVLPCCSTAVVSSLTYLLGPVGAVCRRCMLPDRFLAASHAGAPLAAVLQARE